MKVENMLEIAAEAAKENERNYDQTIVAERLQIKES